MYLESSARINNLYYEKFGFRVENDIHLLRAEKPVTMSIMTRRPHCKIASESLKTENVVSA